jgi:hypothetical protein
MPGQPQTFSPQELQHQESPHLSGPNPPDPDRYDPQQNQSGSLHGGKLSGRTAPVWLQRLSLFVLVLFCVYLGVLMMVLPWWTRVWDHNALILAHPPIAAFLQNGAVRGVITGLGLLDIWIGISEAVHYRDYRG